ncbi:hypothetical protein IC582_001966 [Cucumis melo]
MKEERKELLDIFPSFDLSSILPIEEIVGLAHHFEAKVLVDACQSVSHMVVDGQALDANFLVASSHKAIGLGAAIDYLSGIEMQKNHSYEEELADYLYENFYVVPNIQIYGPAPTTHVQRVPLCSFNIGDIHPTNIATFLDQQVCPGIGPYEILLM